jgi:hypothetical protein
MHGQVPLVPPIYSSGFDWALVDDFDPQFVEVTSNVEIMNSILTAIVKCDFSRDPRLRDHMELVKLMRLAQVVFSYMIRCQNSLEKDVQEKDDEIYRLKSTLSGIRRKHERKMAALIKKARYIERCPGCGVQFVSKKKLADHIQRRHPYWLDAWLAIGRNEPAILANQVATVKGKIGELEKRLRTVEKTQMAPKIQPTIIERTPAPLERSDIPTHQFVRERSDSIPILHIEPEPEPIPVRPVTETVLRPSEASAVIRTKPRLTSEAKTRVRQFIDRVRSPFFNPSSINEYAVRLREVIREEALQVWRTGPDQDKEEIREELKKDIGTMPVMPENVVEEEEQEPEEQEPEMHEEEERRPQKAKKRKRKKQQKVEEIPAQDELQELHDFGDSMPLTSSDEISFHESSMGEYSVLRMSSYSQPQSEGGAKKVVDSSYSASYESESVGEVAESGSERVQNERIEVSEDSEVEKRPKREVVDKGRAVASLSGKKPEVKTPKGKKSAQVPEAPVEPEIRSGKKRKTKARTHESDVESDVELEVKVDQKEAVTHKSESDEEPEVKVRKGKAEWRTPEPAPQPEVSVSKKKKAKVPSPESSSEAEVNVKVSEKKKVKAPSPESSSEAEVDVKVSEKKTKTPPPEPEDAEPVIRTEVKASKKPKAKVPSTESSSEADVDAKLDKKQPKAPLPKPLVEPEAKPVEKKASAPSALPAKAAEVKKGDEKAVSEQKRDRKPSFGGAGLRPLDSDSSDLSDDVWPGKPIKTVPIASGGRKEKSSDGFRSTSEGPAPIMVKGRRVEPEVDDPFERELDAMSLALSGKVAEKKKPAAVPKVAAQRAVQPVKPVTAKKDSFDEDWLDDFDDL